MKRNLIVLLTILVCGLTACKPGQKKDGNMEKETKLKIETVSYTHLTLPTTPYV